MPTIAELRASRPRLADLSDAEVVEAMSLQYPDVPRDKIAKDLGVIIPTAEPAGRSTLDVVKDTGISALKGAIGVPEAVVGLADIVTAGHAGRAAEGLGFRPREAKAMLDEHYSDPQKRANAAVAEADGFLPTLGAAISNPSVIAHSVVESLPSMAAGGLAGRAALAAGGGALSRAAGAAAPMLAGAAGEGAMMAGAAAEQIRQQTEDGLLTPGQAVAAATTGVAGAGLSILGGAVAKKLGLADVDTAIAAGKLNPQAGKGFVRRVLEGAMVEGGLEEMPQSIMEQVLQNAALGKPLDTDVDHAAVLGLLSGAAMGGGANVLGGGKPAAASEAGNPVSAPPLALTNDSVISVDGQGQAATGQQRTMRAQEQDIEDLPFREIGPLARAAGGGTHVPGTPDAAAAGGNLKEAIALLVADEAKNRPDPDAVLERMHRQAAAELQETRQWSARQPEAIREGDVTQGGKPFKNKAAVLKTVGKGATGSMLEVDGGFIFRPAGATTSAIDAAAHQAATSPTNDLPEPTDAQKAAGNYKKGHARVLGLDVTIENPRGSVRSGVDPGGKPWSREMSDHYGYVKRTKGADEEQVDVYVGPQPEAANVFVVDQIKQDTGEFDEHKVMIGYPDIQAAIAAYSSNFDDGWEVGPVTPLATDAFKRWLKVGDLTRPIARTDKKVPPQRGTAPAQGAAPGAPAPAAAPAADPADADLAGQRAKPVANKAARVEEPFPEETPVDSDANVERSAVVAYTDMLERDQTNSGDPMTPKVRRQFRGDLRKALDALAPLAPKTHGALRERAEAALAKKDDPVAAKARHDANAEAGRLERETGDQRPTDEIEQGHANDKEALRKLDLALADGKDPDTGKKARPPRLRELEARRIALAKDIETDAAQLAKRAGMAQKDGPAAEQIRARDTQQEQHQAAATWWDANVGERKAALREVDMSVRLGERQSWNDLTPKAKDLIAGLLATGWESSGGRVKPAEGLDVDALDSELTALVKKAQDAENAEKASLKKGQTGKINGNEWGFVKMAQSALHEKGPLAALRELASMVGFRGAHGNWAHFLGKDIEALLEKYSAPDRPLPGKAQAANDKEDPLPQGEVVILASAEAFAAEMRQVDGEDERARATFNPSIKPVSLPRISTANPTPKGMEFLDPAEAAERLASWKAEAERQGREYVSANANRTVISLFDASGVISQPWVDAGYNVVNYDLQNGVDINEFSAENLLNTHGNDEVWAILAQPPCTDFASSGAQWWKDKDADGRTEASNELVRQALRTIELFRPPVWVMENPVGRIATQNGLPKPLLQFDPWHYGDNYTKRTELYGNFNNELPQAPVEPTQGSKVHSLSSSAKYERSLTPEGFSYALFMANNAESFSVADRMSREFPGVDAALFGAALEAGSAERHIRDQIEDSYYDSDLEYVREELARLAAAKPKKTEPAREIIREVAAGPAKYTGGHAEIREQLRADWPTGTRVRIVHHERMGGELSATGREGVIRGYNAVGPMVRVALPPIGRERVEKEVWIHLQKEGAHVQTADRIEKIEGAAAPAAAGEKARASNNKIFTDEAAEAARAVLRDKLKLKGPRKQAGQVPMLDPAVLQAGMTLAGWHIENGARNFGAFAKAMLEDMGNGIRPFLKSWYMGIKYDPRMAEAGAEMSTAAFVEEFDVTAVEAPMGDETEESEDVPGDNERVERDRGEPAADAEVAGDDGGRPKRAAAPGRRGVPADGKRGQQSAPGLFDDSAPAGGERGDIDVHRGDAGVEPSSGIAGSDFADRSDDIGVDGVPPDADADVDAGAVAAGGAGDVEKRAAQRAAQRVPVKQGDLDNIRATLPYLLPAQQEDVHTAETRFAKEDGYGMLFTNGTGTGKTFSGLGVVKRFERQRKDDILIVVPDEKIGDDWIESALPLALNIKRLESTKTAGSGIVLTTYANLSENDELARRNWSLIVADEAHMLMQSADGKETGYIQRLRAISGHPGGTGTRYEMLNREDINRAQWLHAEITANAKIMNNDDTMDVMVQSLRETNEQLQAEADALAKKLAAARKEVEASVMASQGHKRTRATFLSATPFAYEKTIDWAEGYLFDYAEGYTGDATSRGYNEPGAREQFFMSHFGYRMRYNKLTEPDGSKVDRGLMQRQFNAWMKKRGSLSGRMLDIPADYDRRFVLIDSAIGNRIDEALDWLNQQRRAADKNDRGFSKVADIIGDKFDYLSRRYLLEAIKATEVVPIVKQHLALGRKVVVFHDYKKGGGFHPFLLQEKRITSAMDDEQKQTAEQYNRARAAFVSEFADLVEFPFHTMPSPIQVFRREFGDQALLINGDEKQKDLLARYKTFQNDATGPLVALVQSDKNKGWSGHDTTGKNQRVLINLGQPTAPTRAIQQEGRIYRTGGVSDAIFRYLNTGTNWERWAFANTIASRASTAENLGMGELARALKDSFIAAFDASDTYAPGHEGEGKGGKLMDRAANNALSEWDRAKTFYWATEKKNSKTKAKEGADYFATPEPLGFKMVEWLDLRGGEAGLEPSAGHGAIARWMPDIAKRTVVEPSLALRSRLAMVMNPVQDRILESTFEELDIGANKFDGIVMNPPFGTGGKLAVEHLAKAARHLNDGGRIVALIPTGPAADKQFDRWFYEKSTRPVRPLGVAMIDGKGTPIYKGDTIESRASWAPEGVVTGWRDGAPMVKATAPEFQGTGATLVSGPSIKAVRSTGPRTEEFSAAEGLQLVRDIRLPQVTFERAGTAVATRVVVIEKTKEDVSGRGTTDLSGLNDIKDLFDRLEHLSVPPRKKAAEAEAPEVRRNAAPAPAPAQAGPVAAGADEALVEHTTAKGKVIRGVVRKGITKEQAQEIDAYTFKKDGGWFIREKHLAGPKPTFRQADTSPAAAGLSVPELQSLMDGFTSDWPNAPEVTVLPSVAHAGTPDEVKREALAQMKAGGREPQAVFYNGEVLVFADAISGEDRAVQILFHEVLGHAGLHGAFGGELKPILRQIASARPAEVAAMIRRRGLKQEDRLIAAEEILAEMAEKTPQLGFVRRAIAAIKNYLRAKLPAVFSKLELTDADIIQAYILPARAWIQGGGPRGGQGAPGAPSFSQARGLHRREIQMGGKWRHIDNSKGQLIAGHDLDAQQAFWKWFGDSKVVDAEGKPLVVYHGTASDIKQFDPTRSGRNYGYRTGTRGIFFTSNHETASVYAETPARAYLNPGGPEAVNFGSGTANIMPVYLSLQRPLETRTKHSPDKFFDSNYKSLFERAEKAGADGIVIHGAGEYQRSVYVAFQPEQIKSATGNRGSYDGKNPDIRFSQRADAGSAPAAAPGLNDPRDFWQAARGAVDELVNSPGKLTWWQKTFGTPYDLAQRHPQTFGRVYDRVQEFLRDVSLYATEAADLAPSILPKLDTWKDAFKDPLSAEDTKAIQAPIFEGTLVWARDHQGKPFKPEPDDDVKVGIVWTPQELQQQFKLTGTRQKDGTWSGQIGLYQEARAAIDKSLTSLVLADMLRYAGKDAAPIADVVMETASLAEGSRVLGEYLQSLADADPGRAAVLEDIIGKVGKKAGRGRELIAQGYAPLTRFGTHTVDVVDADGKRVYFGLFESRHEGRDMADKMAKLFPGATIRRGTTSQEEHKLFAGMTPETAELFGEMLGLEAGGEGAKDLAFQEFLKQAKAGRSAMKRLIHRKGIAGFSEDVGRVLAGFVYSNARQTSSSLHGKALVDRVQAIPQGQGELKDMAVKLLKYVTEPQEEAVALRSVLFAQYLGGSAAAMMVNMTQPFAVTAPYLTQFTSVGKVAGYMKGALRDVWKDATGDKALDAALKLAAERGIVAPQEVHQLMRQAQGKATLVAGDGTALGKAKAEASNLLSRASLLWGQPFAVAELFNRRLTFIAAYRLAVEQGKADPAGFAEKAINDTQFTYNKGNKPQWARGAVGSVLFTFKQYSISYLELAHRMYTQGGPEGKKAALLMLAMLMLMGGAGGLPFVEDVSDVIDGIGQRMGYNLRTRHARQEFLRETLGQHLGGFIDKGVTGLPGMPIDVAARFGMGNLIPGTGLLTKKQDHTRDVVEFIGPVGDLAQRAFQGASMVADGDIAKGVLQASPTAARNLAKSAEMANLGFYTDTRGKKVIDTTGFEAFVKAVGFQPHSVAQAQEASRDVMQLKGVVLLKESEIADRWARAVFAKDEKAAQSARDEVVEWNRKNPDSPIKIQASQITKRVREMNRTKAQRLEASSPREIRNQVRNELAGGGQ